MKYETSDLYFAAFLMVAKVPFLEFLKEEGRVKFRFSHPGSHVIRELKSEYFSGVGKVSALSFSQSLKFLKSGIKSD